MRRRVNAIGQEVRRHEAGIGLSTRSLRQIALKCLAGHFRLVTSSPACLPPIKLGQNDRSLVRRENTEVVRLRFKQTKVERADRFTEKFPYATLFTARSLGE